MKEFTKAQKETLKARLQEIKQVESRWNLFVQYLMLEYEVDDKWEFTLDGFKEKETKPKEVENVPEK